jgi:hypothetical protein
MKRQVKVIERPKRRITYRKVKHVKFVTTKDLQEMDRYEGEKNEK